VVKLIQVEFGDDLCFAYRHFPLIEIHPHAETAAEGAESAERRIDSRDMHDIMFRNSSNLDFASIPGLDVDRFRHEVSRRRYHPRIREDIGSGLGSGVDGTPTFFINGARYEGGYDLESMVQALRPARRAAR
jgi:protein-disulfide isomerase